MASKLLGRCECPLKCGNKAAHVKIKTDKAEGKEALPYIYCPSDECGVMLHAKNKRQAAHLLAMTRPENPAPEPVQEPTPTGIPAPVAEPVPEPIKAPPAPPKPANAWLFPLFNGGQQ